MSLHEPYWYYSMELGLATKQETTYNHSVVVSSFRLLSELLRMIGLPIQRNFYMSVEHDHNTFHIRLFPPTFLVLRRPCLLVLCRNTER